MIATTRTHRRSVCHALVGACAWLGAAACSPAVGWERETARVCEAESPAVVCVQAVPDRGVEFDVGGATLVPGECARAPERGGAVRVAWTDADATTHERRIRAAPRRRTELALGADGELRVIAKAACDPAMPPFHPLP